MPGAVLTEAELFERVRVERAAGRTFAFANGCFDVLHVGHVRYLAGAAAEADRLIVAVNDDASVAALKGPGRPVQTALDRAELITAIVGDNKGHSSRDVIARIRAQERG